MQLANFHSEAAETQLDTAQENILKKALTLLQLLFSKWHSLTLQTSGR